jgi:16S rRNA (cytosine967-C5)-methyltransferase
MRPAGPTHPDTSLARLLLEATEVLRTVQRGRSLDAALAHTPPALRAGTQDLAYRALRAWGGALDWRARLARRAPPEPLATLLGVALALLEPAVDDAPAYPDHVLVDQGVRAARSLGGAGAGGFANAVLRERIRRRGSQPVQADPSRLARLNLPDWWWARLVHDWGEPMATRIAQAGARRPPLVLRVNRRRAAVAAVVQAFSEVGIEAVALDDLAIHVPQPRPVAQLPGFDAGWWSVQDTAAQQAARRLLGGAGGPRPLPAGARVLDACAAPGGKTAHLLECQELDLLALDRDAERLARIGPGLARLGLSAELRCADAAEPAAWWDGRPFDAILLDAPCSASGVVRRHPDVPWLRRASDLPALAQQQDRLLEALWPTLATGGRMLYATCSVFRDEGSKRIDSFLQRRADARPVPGVRPPEHLLPVPDNDFGSKPAGDGFFYALIEKT